MKTPRFHLAAAALSAFCVSHAADSAEPKMVPFKFATQTLSVPEGFTVELVAGPPAVNRPISIALDERGRLYATDSSGLSDRADKQFELKPHRVDRLVDTNGDGIFDQATVFAEHMMFPQGAMFYEGSLYVGAPPHIWKLTDRNDDGVSDERTAWYDGKTLTGCANDLHGPYFGPDGWFYWTKGASAEQTHTLVNGKNYVSRAAHILRSRPDGSGWEPVLTGGMDNPVGVTFTASGERILSGTFFQVGTPGKRDGLIHSIYGGVYGKEQPSTIGHPRTGDLMPIMTHMGAAAPCGITTYRSRQFGADYEDNIFVCYFNLRKISRHQLAPDGATFKTIDTDFVTSDSLDFHPTDVLDDADGSLLVVDTGGWYKICCPTSQLTKPDVLGAIYRVRKVGAPKVDDPRGLNITWTSLATVDLCKLLGDARPYVAERAKRDLGKKGEAAIPALGASLAKKNSVAMRRNAVWTLARIDTADAHALVRSALDDTDASVVHSALQVVSLWRDRAAVERLIKFVESNDAMRQRLAAEALGRIGDGRAIEPLLAATRRIPAGPITATGTPETQAEHILEHALIYALIEIGHSREVMAHLGANEPPRSLRAAMVALDQMENSGMKPEPVLAALKASVPMLKNTAGWVVGHHAEWGEALAGFFRGQLNVKHTSEAERTELERQLIPLAKSEAIQELLATTARDGGAPMDSRLLALRAMAAAGLKETPAVWFSTVAGLTAEKDLRLVAQAVTTAHALPMPKGGNAELARALARAGRDAHLPDDVRVDALAATPPAALAPVEPALFDFLSAHLDGQQPMMVRSSAAAVLAKAPLSPAQQLGLAEKIKTVGPLEAPKLLPAFERAPNEALGLKLVASLKQSPGLPGIRANMLKPVLAKYSKPVQAQGEELFTLLNADAARQSARVDELLNTCKDGDIRRGQVVFHSAKAACALCHMMGYRGGRLGPDLTSIGKIRNERELLESVIFPSATFVRGYEPYVVTTKSGESVSGILRKDAIDEVILATGPESEQHVARADIKEIAPGAVSPMPPGFEVILSPQELADLMAFLKSRT